MTPVDQLLQQWMDDAEEDEYFFTNIMQANLVAVANEYRNIGDKHRCANIDRDRLLYAERLERDYWGPNPTYSLKKFRLRFRMQRDLFDRILRDISLYDIYFLQKVDALGLLGFTANQKMTCALRFLAYGTSADQLDELIRMGETTILYTLKRFCCSIIDL